MKKHFLFLSALALFLSSCEIFSSLSEKTGAISIKMPEGSERIAETYDVNEITSFTAELYDSGSSPVAKVSSAPGKSITFESLTPGSYAIVIKAFKSTECAAYAEKSGIVVEAGATTYETVTLFKNVIKNIESVEIAKESLDKITKNYTVGQTFALPEAVSITARFTSGYEKELEPDDYEIYICNAEQFAESSLVKDLTLSAKARFAAVGICTESGHKKYSEPVSLVMNAEEPVVTWTIPVVKDNEISFKISASASGNISYTWQKASTAGMEEKTECEIKIESDGTVTLPLKDDSGGYIYYVCTVTNENSSVNGTKTASIQTDVFGGQLKSFIAEYTGEYEVPGQLDDITAFKITETYADGSVSIIQSLSANYKVSYDKNLSDTERLVGNIPLVITNIAALDEAGENLTCTVTVPFKYSFDEDALDFVITADSKNVEGGTVKIAQYTGTVALSAYNNLPVYRLYDNGIYTDISNTVSYAWYADEELSTTIENGTIGNLVENVTYYYCVQTITSNPDEWYVPSAKYQKSITIETEPWVIEITKDGSGTYTLSCTNSCANGSEKITFEGKGESVTIEGNSLTIKQQADNTTATITAYINGQSAATKEYTIPAEGTYIVTFNTDGGSEVSSQTVNYNGTVATPEEPTKAGYTFAGWYTDAGCTTEYNFATSVTGNITLYAKWTVEVITDWTTLSAKLNNVKDDVGNVYVSGDFEIASTISFSGTAKIIPTGSVTFTRSADYKIFDIASGATLTFAGTDSAPIVFDGNSISSKNPMIYSSGTLTLENCTLQNAVNSSTGSCGAVESSGTTNITNCTFTSNSASYGGAIQIYSGTVNISSITCSRNSATSGNDIYNYNGTLNIGGTVSSIDIYMNNSLDAYSPVLVPVKGITLANETDTINIEMYECSAETTVLTQSDGMTTSDFAAAINCFTLTNNGFVIGSDGKAETEPTEPTEPTATTVSSFSELTTCLTSYSDSKATANIVISKDIEITGTVTIYCNVNINADATGRTLSRGANFTDALFQIGTDVTGVTVNVGGSDGTLTIDGKGNTVKASFSLINAGSGGNTVKISKNAILQNNVTSRTHGAAIYADGSTVIIEGGTVQNNDCSAKSKSYGGAIYATNFEMSSGSISGNNSVSAGGVYVLGYANITGGTISNNTASEYGGGIYLVGVTNSSISGVTFERNTGTTRGGAIYIAGTSTVDITDCTFTDNVSNNGKAFAFTLTGGTTSIGGKINITNDDNIVIYNSDGILNISKSLEITKQIPLTIYTVTSGHQYITASDGITLSGEISKFSLQNEGYTLTDGGVLQTN
ncbi:InlB B-repeat-containing protein [Treponema porcinum]|uniref:InlB B-repeat-containing protein n=1 Tax=Treponema porcinum TaxID=261392 RepID=UPI002A805E2B|nr:InlB B-repeat-containing protein [Treponema porcinum]MDY4468729.1 InlB B-repeat-containing protein [Treponema porcinum]